MVTHLICKNIKYASLTSLKTTTLSKQDNAGRRLI